MFDSKLPDWAFINTIGFILILIGFVIIFLAVFLLAFSSAKTKSKVKGGGVVLIGPFPIIFGTDEESVKILLVLTIIVVMLVIILLLLTCKW